MSYYKNKKFGSLKKDTQSHYGVVDDLIYNDGDCTAVIRIGRIKVEINDDFIIYCNNLKSEEG